MPVMWQCLKDQKEGTNASQGLVQFTWDLAALGNLSRFHVSIPKDCAINSRFRRHISILRVSSSAK
jgi:hypothetical protein